MNWSNAPILTVIAIGVVGFGLMVVAFIMVARAGGTNPATQGAEDRPSLPRRLMFAGASLGVVFGLAMGILFLIPGGIPWMEGSDGGVALISSLTGLGAVWYFITKRPQTVGGHSEQSNTGSGG